MMNQQYDEFHQLNVAFDDPEGGSIDLITNDKD
jgi:hypothetical protein